MCTLNNKGKNHTVVKCRIYPLSERYRISVTDKTSVPLRPMYLRTALVSRSSWKRNCPIRFSHRQASGSFCSEDPPCASFSFSFKACNRWHRSLFSVTLFWIWKLNLHKHRQSKTKPDWSRNDVEKKEKIETDCETCHPCTDAEVKLAGITWAQLGGISESLACPRYVTAHLRPPGNSEASFKKCGNCTGSKFYHKLYRCVSALFKIKSGKW